VQAAKVQRDSLPWVINISLRATRLQQHADIESNLPSLINLMDVWDSTKYNTDKFCSHLTANKLHLHNKVQSFNAVKHDNPNWLLWLRTATLSVCGPGSSVGIETDYGLDGPGIESRWGEIFPPVQTGPGAHPASCTMGTGSFPGVKCGWGGRPLPLPLR
jgi:hypothetical protein